MMRTWIGMATALLLILPQAVMAQERGPGGGGPHGGAPGGGSPGGAARSGGPGGPGGGGARFDSGARPAPSPSAAPFGGGGRRDGAVSSAIGSDRRGGDVRGARGPGDRGPGVSGPGGQRGPDDRGPGAGGPGGQRGFAVRNPEGYRAAGNFRPDRGPGGASLRGDRGIAGQGVRGGRGFPRPPAGGWRRGWYAGQSGGWDRIRGPRYSYPRGWSYRRWGVGALLPGVLFGSAYYWNDWQPYGLYQPPYGDRWVRYGPDLLLVDIRTGRVEDVIYGAFY